MCLNIISSSSFYNVLGLWHSCHVTTIMCLFIVQKKKEKKNQSKSKENQIKKNRLK